VHHNTELYTVRILIERSGVSLFGYTQQQQRVQISSSHQMMDAYVQQQQQQREQRSGSATKPDTV
jgi:hypothetical protein